MPALPRKVRPSARRRFSSCLQVELLEHRLLLATIPLLNSLPGAPVALYLDFDSHFDSRWGAYRNISTPAFDQDGATTSLNDRERTAIEQIWRAVAEDYAPFNLNVTTVAPPSFANGKALRVAVGGTGSWTGGAHGGLSYVNSFTNSIVNTVYVFAKNLGNGNARYVADAISHEAGHGFGLEHQSEYAGTVKIADYNDGSGDGRAPLMGNSYSAGRSLWWKGATHSSTRIQDDMTLLARLANRFGYRPDDHGNSIGSAKSLTVAGKQASGTGVIMTTADLDYFSFTTLAGQVNLSVSVPANINNLDARMELRNAAGTLLVSADPSTSFGATIATTVSAGTYYLVVASHGGYGDVGQYTISGTIPGAGTPSVSAVTSAPPNLPAAPSNLVAAVISSQRVDLRWQNRATNETGIVVQRSSNGGSTWTNAGVLGADAQSFSDTTVAANQRYSYRVYAYNGIGGSYTSNAVTLITSGPSQSPGPSPARALFGTAGATISPSAIDQAFIR